MQTMCVGWRVLSGGKELAMRRLAAVWLSALLFGVLCAPALANDSTAELSVGGLVFTRNADISMESEELTITTDQVSVRYVFLNQSQNPVTVTVAFPLPDIDLSEAENYAIPTNDPVN